MNAIEEPADVERPRDVRSSAAPGSEEAAAAGRLTVLGTRDRQDTQYLLDREDLVVGRHPTADIRLDDPLVSRFHARLRVSGSSVLLEDLGSTGGTRVNGARLQGPCHLQSGDVVSFATVDARYEQAEKEVGDITGVVDATSRSGAPPAARSPKRHRKVPVIAILGLIVAAISAVAAAYPVFFRSATNNKVADYQASVATFCRDVSGELDAHTFYTLPGSGGFVFDKQAYLNKLAAVPGSLRDQFRGLSSPPKSLSGQFETAQSEERSFETAVTAYATALAPIPVDQLNEDATNPLPGPSDVWRPLQAAADGFGGTLDRLAGGRCSAPPH
jgi:pSer/pThr/pTyr-binding forkhead associated (FHA) protein